MLRPWSASFKPKKKNFHLDHPAELDVRRFSETLADRGMIQLVKSPTHRGGHILDVVIVRETGSIISALPTVYDPCLCDKQGNISGDHLAVRFAVHSRKPARLRKVVTFRRLRQICVSDFAQDIASSMDLSSDGSVTELVLHYNSDLRSIVDHHAPLQKSTVTLRPNSPWFTDTLRQEKRNRRQLERTWLRTRLEVHRQAYRTNVWPSTACCSLRKANIIRKRLLLAEEIRNKMQSAYRAGHSTETALLRIKNDIDAALDRKSMVILVMLDLLSAFDTIEHEVLLTRLEHTFGITDKALAWLRSYLSERHQNVVVDSTMSADYVLQCGVPQGSVLGPVL